MRLLNVRLHGFGQFNKGLDVSFSPQGLTVVLGRNEAGKSTLLNAIVGVLFGFRDLNLIRKYEPWDDYDTFGGEILLETDDGRRLRFSRDFRTQHADVIEIKGSDELPLFNGTADPRGNGPEDRQYFRLLGGVLGFQDEAIFRSTVFFAQQGLQTAVSDQIRRMLTGSSDVDYKGALHDLHSRFSDLTTENPWKARGSSRKRLIEETRSDLEEARDAWAEGRETLLRSMEVEDEIARLQGELVAAEEELLGVREQVETHQRLHELLGRREAAAKRYMEALSRRDNLKRYEDRSREIEERLLREWSAFRTAPSDLPDLIRSYESATHEMEAEEMQLREEEHRLSVLKPSPNTSLAWFLLVLMLGVGLALGAITPFGLPAGAICGLGLGALAYAIGRNIGTGYAEARAAIEERIAALKASISGRRKRIDEIVARTGSLLVGRSPADVLADHARYQELREEKKRLGAALAALGGHEAITRAFEEASREQGVVDGHIETLTEEHPELRGMDDRGSLGILVRELKERAQALETKVNRARVLLEEHRVELAGLSARMDFDLAVLEDDIREKQESLAHYDLERDALRLAIDTLDECVKDFQEGDIFRLGEEISRIFTRITGEKYTRVHLGTSLEPVISRGDDLPISPGDLSQGARDQLYFAMRVAMARHLSRQVNLPLFLDDPFVNFDRERLQVTHDVLDNLDEHQVVMVTCDPEYAAWGRELIDLDEIKARTAA